MKILPILLSDSYKQFHNKMYPNNLTMLYSNMTPRKSRLGTNKAVWFGLQYYIKEYLIEQWNELFFKKDIKNIVAEYKNFHKDFSFVENIDTAHIEKLHELGYLPLEIKALPEGTLVPMRVPFFTIKNTHPDFAWLVNFLETAMSTTIWDATTVATISYEYKKLLTKYAKETGDESFVQWQGHDFSMRGRSSIESSFNQAGHLLSFTGSDTIPAVYFLQQYYNANMSKELIASSVPATEHSVMMAGGKTDEIGTFKELMDKFPKGILSVVSDTWDLWKVCTEYLPKLKKQILARDGKLVIRPDSGDPVDILCGDNESYEATSLEGRSATPKKERYIQDCMQKGVIELLWDVFGGTVNEKGYKVLDPHIGVLYGDSITLDRAEQICERLKAKGFASTNVVLGIGSYTFNYNTRDTLGMAIKATYCERDNIGYEIFKDPITDDGTKKSAKGLLCVVEENKELKLYDQCNLQEEKKGLLETVFLNGKLIKDQSLKEIRERLNNQQQ